MHRRYCTWSGIEDCCQCISRLYTTVPSEGDCLPLCRTANKPRLLLPPNLTVILWTPTGWFGVLVHILFENIKQELINTIRSVHYCHALVRNTTFNRQVCTRLVETGFVFGSARELSWILDECFLDRQYVTVVNFRRLVVRIIVDRNVVFVPGYFWRFAFNTVIY